MFINSTKLLFTSTMIVGVMVTMCSNNWFMIWAGMEISLMCLIPIISGFNMMSSESSMKYFIVQGASSSIMILGLVLMLTKLTDSNFFLLISMAIKLGMAPFHNWVLIMVDGLSYNSNFILLTLMKIAPLTMLSYLSMDCSFLILFSMIVGSIFALNQSSIRKILAYSSIFNLSFLGASLNFLSMWLIYLFVYSLILFSLIIFLKKMNVNYMNQVLINEYSSLCKLSLWIILLSLSGIPPLMGFLSKLMIFELLINQGDVIIFSVMIFTSLIVTFYYMRMMYLSLMFSSLKFKWLSMNLNKLSLVWPMLNLMMIPIFCMMKMFS